MCQSTTSPTAPHAMTYDPADVVRCFESVEEVADKYTVVFADSDSYLSMSENPYHPQGVGMTGEGYVLAAMEDETRNREIEFAALPEKCQKCVRAHLTEWFTCMVCGGYIDYSPVGDNGETAAVGGGIYLQVAHSDCAASRRIAARDLQAGQELQIMQDDAVYYRRVTAVQSDEVGGVAITLGSQQGGPRETVIHVPDELAVNVLAQFTSWGQGAGTGHET